MAHDGAKVMLCSRQQPILNEAVASLQKQYGQENVSGVLCRFELEEGRRQLIQEVRVFNFFSGFSFLEIACYYNVHLQTVTKFGGIDILVSASAALLMTGLTLEVS